MPTPPKPLKLKFGTNVAWLRKIPNSEKFAGLPLGLVAMTTESCHKLIMENG